MNRADAILINCRSFFIIHNRPPPERKKFLFQRGTYKSNSPRSVQRKKSKISEEEQTQIRVKRGEEEERERRGGITVLAGFPFHVEIAGISIPQNRMRLPDLELRFITDLEADQTVNGCVGRLISGSRPLFSHQARDKSNNRRKGEYFRRFCGDPIPFFLSWR